MGKLSTGTILVVEDNPDDRALIERALRKNNVMNDVVMLRDGEEAVHYFSCTGEFAGRDPNDLPEVVLLDLQMPKVGGLQVLKFLRGQERTKTLPVVVLTSSDEQRDIVDSYQGGANSYVSKPLDFHEFVAAVQQLGVYWLLINRTTG